MIHDNRTSKNLPHAVHLNRSFWPNCLYFILVSGPTVSVTYLSWWCVNLEILLSSPSQVLLSENSWRCFLLRVIVTRPLTLRLWSTYLLGVFPHDVHEASKCSIGMTAVFITHCPDASFALDPSIAPNRTYYGLLRTDSLTLPSILRLRFRTILDQASQNTSWEFNIRIPQIPSLKQPRNHRIITPPWHQVVASFCLYNAYLCHHGLLHDEVGLISRYFLKRLEPPSNPLVPVMPRRLGYLDALSPQSVSSCPFVRPRSLREYIWSLD